MAQLARGGDLPLLLQLAAAMTRCNLAGMAKLLLRSTGDAVRQQHHVRAMLEQIEQTPSGEQSSFIWQERYRNNVVAVCEGRPHLRALLNVDDPPEHVRFYRSRAGNMHAVRESGDGTLRTIFPFIDFRTQAANAQFPKPTLLSATALIGVPSHAILERLLDQSVQRYRPPIDVIETDLEALRMWLCMLNDVEAFRDNRVGIHAGPAALDAYAECLIASPNRITPTMVLTNHRPNWKPPAIDAAWRQQVDARARRRRAGLLIEAEARVAGRSITSWRDRFRNAAADSEVTPLRIVGFTNRYSTVVQHAMRDLAAAFARIGHRFDVVMQPDDCSANVDVAGTLASDDYDLVFAINHLRFEYPDSMPRNLPFVGWLQDHMDHLWRNEAGASVGDLDLVVAHAPDVLCGLYGYRRDRMLPSSNLTDPQTYSAEPLPESELEPHRCDLSFVSHGAETPDELVNEIKQATNETFGRMMALSLALLGARLEREGCLNAQQLLEVMLQAEHESGHPPLTPQIRRSVVYPQIARIHDRLFRHQTLAWAARWADARRKSLRIYGRGWVRHPTLARYATSEVASGRALRAVFQASTLNLQVNAYSSLHQRLLDAVACGGTVISRHNPADFVRGPFVRVASAIRENRLQSLAELVELRQGQSPLSAACDEAERLSGLVIRTIADQRRLDQIRVLRESNDIPELQEDSGLFAMLRDSRFIPARVASDIPGFDRVVFRTETEMHELLDRLFEDADSRRDSVAQMRPDVLKHDTFDGLVARIIATFADGAAT